MRSGFQVVTIWPRDKDQAHAPCWRQAQWDKSVPMRRNPVLLAMVLVGLTVLAGSAAPSGPGTPPQPTMAPPGVLLWADEFEGPAGAAPDQGRWRQEIGGGGWGNGELQYYTGSTANAATDGNGNLAITAREESLPGARCHYGTCRYTSARLLTEGRFSHAYGRFEARLKVPQGRGFWPAFWMLGDNVFTDGWPLSGEIDVMENVGQEPGTISGSLHGPGYSGVRSLSGVHELPAGRAVGENFHVFTVDWEPDRITWYMDGVKYSTKSRAETPGSWVFDHKFFLLLNLAVGGHWPGPPDGATSFPQSLLVDYVRVYELPQLVAEPKTPVQGLGEKCLGAEGPLAAGAALILADCGGPQSTEWTFERDGTARSLGLCMEASGVNAASRTVGNGVLLRLAGCNGSPGQQFRLNDSGDIVNSRSGKCADAFTADGNKNDGVQLWDCAGTKNQKWWKLS